MCTTSRKKLERGAHGTQAKFEDCTYDMEKNPTEVGLSTCTTNDECEVETDGRPICDNNSINMARQKEHIISTIGARPQIREAHPIPVTHNIDGQNRATSRESYTTPCKRHTVIRALARIT